MGRRSSVLPFAVLVVLVAVAASWFGRRKKQTPKPSAPPVQPPPHPALRWDAPPEEYAKAKKGLPVAKLVHLPNLDLRRCSVQRPKLAFT